MKKDLTPFINNYYTKGIPPQELTDNPTEQRRLRDLFNVFEMYRTNPLINVADVFKYKYGHSLKLIPEDLVYFEYIRTTFAPVSRRQKIDIVNYAVERVLSDAMQSGDNDKILKAADKIIKVNQLDKPQAEESVVKNTATLPIYLTTSPKTVTQDAIEYTDEELEKQIKLFGAHENVYKKKILDKRKELELLAAVPADAEQKDQTEQTSDELPQQ